MESGSPGPVGGPQGRPTPGGEGWPRARRRAAERQQEHGHMWRPSAAVPHNQARIRAPARTRKGADVARWTCEGEADDPGTDRQVQRTASPWWTDRRTKPCGWLLIDWRAVEDDVRCLRQRIFTASKEGDLNKVRNLQKLMLRSRANAHVSVRRRGGRSLPRRRREAHLSGQLVHLPARGAAAAQRGVPADRPPRRDQPRLRGRQDRRHRAVPQPQPAVRHRLPVAHADQPVRSRATTSTCARATCCRP